MSGKFTHTSNQGHTRTFWSRCFGKSPSLIPETVQIIAVCRIITHIAFTSIKMSVSLPDGCLLFKAIIVPASKIVP